MSIHQSKVRVLIGDIFESQAQTWVNTVNCVGVMGKGIALGFKRRFPEMYRDYVERCKRGEVELGRPYLYRYVIPPWILNFPTKDHWRSVSKLSDIVAGLQYLERHYRKWEIESLAVPPLGAGEGQLEWRVVGPTLYRYLSKLDVPVELYAPFNTPELELDPEFLAQGSIRVPESRLRPAWVALVAILDRIEQHPLHWPVGRTTFQKIAYFATMKGIPTGLEYQRGSYGPFAPQLKVAISRLVNNDLLRERQLGRMLKVEPGPTYPDAVRSFAPDLNQWHKEIDQIVDLFLRTSNTKQAEIAATVHFAAVQLKQERGQRPAESDVLDEVLAWKLRRRPPLRSEEVAMTIRNLATLGWLDVEPSQDLPLSEEEMLTA
jgi:O-acetyl-ADP-ribose deacetylase (regulator of RNase III)/uncharacterized protein YwgA